MTKRTRSPQTVDSASRDNSPKATKEIREICDNCGKTKPEHTDYRGHLICPGDGTVEEFKQLWREIDKQAAKVADILVGKPLCEAVVFTREQLRYTGRGKNGFERHHIRHQCKRLAVNGGYCKQHQYKVQGGRELTKKVRDEVTHD